MWTYIAETLSDHAGLVAVLCVMGLFWIDKRQRGIENLCALRSGNYIRMEKQVDWMFKKLGGNGDLL